MDYFLDRAENGTTLKGWTTAEWIPWKGVGAEMGQVQKIIEEAKVHNGPEP